VARYDYQCSKCEHVHEVAHSMTVTPQIQCPLCSKFCVRIVSTSFNIGIPFSCREIWHYSDIKKMKPKWLRSKDGKTKVRFDTSIHGCRKGGESHLNVRKTHKPDKALLVSSESSESSEDN